VVAVDRAAIDEQAEQARDPVAADVAHGDGLETLALALGVQRLSAGAGEGIRRNPPTRLAGTGPLGPDENFFVPQRK
jgi:hypothetical protein